MKVLNLLVALLILTLISSSCEYFEKKSIYPTNLRCENLENPIAIDVASPLLSWNMESTKRGQTQFTYQILVSGSKDKLDKNIGDYWDSGKIESDISINIGYAG